MNSPSCYSNFPEESKFGPFTSHKPSGSTNVDRSISNFQVMEKGDIVDSITQEIDCHCHTYQFWYGIFLLLYVVNFVNAIFIIGGYFTSQGTPGPALLYIIYALMGLIIVIVYILMEIETWTTHNVVLYVYSTLLACLNARMLVALFNAEDSETGKQVILGLLSVATTLGKFSIVPKLKYRAKNLIYLEQERRRVRSECGL